MKRDEEILHAGQKYFETFEHPYGLLPTPLEGFTEGANWADGHPKNPWIEPTVESCDKDGELYKTVKNGDMYFCYLHGDYYMCAAIKLPDGLYMLTTNSKLVPCFDFDFIMKQPRIPRKDEDTAR